MMVKNAGEDNIDKGRNFVGQRDSRVVKQERKLRSGVRSADNSPAPGSKAIAHLNEVKKNVKTGSFSPQSSIPSTIPPSSKLTESLPIDVTSILSPPNIELPLNTDMCPCGVSDKNVWKIDCSKCGRYWHTSCLSMDGISKDSINKMVNYCSSFDLVINRYMFSRTFLFLWINLHL